MIHVSYSNTQHPKSKADVNTVKIQTNKMGNREAKPEQLRVYQSF